MTEESVEDAAVRIAVAMERRLGREARDVRKRREVADVESGGRLIEVKGFAGSFKPRLGSLLFTPQELTHARNNEAYYVYLVENVRSPANAKVRILHGEHLRRVVNDPGVAIQRYSVPLRRADYDAMPRLGTEDVAAAPQIAILGWGSLIRHARRLQIKGPFVQGGPHIPVEFSRRSDRGRLTLVIDRRGDEVPTYFALADYPTLEGAVEGLRQREGSRVRTEEIGVATATAVPRSRDPEVGEAIRAWTQTRNLDATIWTDLDADWPEFTLDLAVDHLRTLANADLEHARRYFDEAPPETNTPLRRHLAGWIRGGALPS